MCRGRQVIGFSEGPGGLISAGSVTQCLRHAGKRRRNAEEKTCSTAEQDPFHSSTKQWALGCDAPHRSVSDHDTEPVEEQHSRRWMSILLGAWRRSADECRCSQLMPRWGVTRRRGVVRLHSRALRCSHQGLTGSVHTLLSPITARRLSPLANPSYPGLPLRDPAQSLPHTTVLVRWGAGERPVCSKLDLWHSRNNGPM